MRNKVAKLGVGVITSLMTLVMAATILLPSQNANADVNSVQATVTYHQSEAREMLDLINEWRSGSVTYNDPNGNEIVLNDLTDLTYDYALEEYAMQRAAELIVKYDHTRPDGTRSLDNSTYNPNAENIARGQSSVETVFTAWREDNLSFAGQGHRRNMLGVMWLPNPDGSYYLYSQRMTSIGIACAEYNGVRYWVQIMRIRNTGAAETVACDSEKTVTINYSEGISDVIACVKPTTYNGTTLSSSTITVSGVIGDEFSCPEVRVVRKLGNLIVEDLTDQYNITWSTTATKPIISGSSFHFESTYNSSFTLKYSTTINGSAVSGSYSIRATITAPDINSATFEDVDARGYYTAQQYTGSEIRPDLTLTYGGRTLVEGTDYQVAYNNNVNVGRATITITGISSKFTGTKVVFFDITEANIEDVTILGLDSSNFIMDRTYTGYQVNPLPTITYNGTTLRSGTDYTLTYNNNINAGVAFIVVEGTGNFEGSRIINFNITPLSISSATVTGVVDATYTGDAITQTPTVKVGTVTLVEGTDYEISYSPNINAGEVTMTITAVDGSNYRGSITKTFTIEPADISGATLSSNDVVYNGNELRPFVNVRYAGTTLTSGTDYSVTYTDNINAGTAHATVTGRGNYTGTATCDFVITPRSISTLSITGTSGYTYTGSAIEPEPTVRTAGVVLTLDEDYTLRYSNNIDAGMATITVVLQGNYTGTITSGFEIASRSVNPENVTLNYSDVVYTGAAQEPVPVVVVNGITLNENIDYTVSYSDNIEIGTATVTIECRGNYSGIVEKTFNIVAAPNINDAVIAGLNSSSYLRSYTYTGSSITPVLSIMYGNTFLTAGEDYTYTISNNTNVGVATVVINGAGIYEGTRTVYFYIEPQNIRDANCTGIEDIIYDGNEVSQNPVITCNGIELQKGVDYILVYTSRVECGPVSLTIIGCGNFTGSIVTSFEILPRDISDSCTIIGCYDEAYTGNPITKNPVVRIGSNTLLAGIEYEVSYESNINAGEATVIITGIGNYTGTATTTFTISPIDISEAVISGINDASYTSSEITQDVSVVLNGMTLVPNTDYIVTYSDNVNAGEATVTITGCGNYSGTIISSFAINPIDISSAVITGVSDATYTGSAIINSPVVRLGSRTLIAGTDYEVSYLNNVDVGTATVVITGINNYEGTTSTAFEITPAPIRSGWVRENNSWTYYDNNGQKATGWKKISNVWYYFNASGIMQTGWQKINNSWYYFNNSGAMLNGWQQISGKWYYFNASGAMQSGWQQISGNWYYFTSSGSMVTGWSQISGNWYYFTSSGSMVTGWSKINNTWYYFNASGSMATGWKQIGGTWYYFMSSGAMATGTQTINGRNYTFSSSGAWVN